MIPLTRAILSALDTRFIIKRYTDLRLYLLSFYLSFIFLRLVTNTTLLAACQSPGSTQVPVKAIHTTATEMN